MRWLWIICLALSGCEVTANVRYEFSQQPHNQAVEISIKRDF